jgi:hypothetical protein
MPQFFEEYWCKIRKFNRNVSIVGFRNARYRLALMVSTRNVFHAPVIARLGFEDGRNEIACSSWN